jgi:hypothetical protein
VAAGHSLDVDPGRWQAGLEGLLGRVAGRFGRVEPRRRARAFVLGLLVDLPRRNCWTIAEHVGNPSPDGMQHLLSRAVWDHDGVRDDLRAYLVERLGDPEAVLVIDETGDLNKGTQTVGVQRQYTGTAGRVENAQVAVYLVYASDAGQALIDRELYLPKGWIDDPQRLKAAGVPDQSGLRPNRPWPQRCSPARWTPACRPSGRPATRSTAPTQICERSLSAAGSAMSWWSPATMAAAPRVTACTTGRSSAWMTATSPGGLGWPALAAGPPQPQDRWAGLLPLLDAPPGRPGHPGPGRRTPLEDPGALPDRQRPGRPDAHQVRRWPSWYRWTTLAMLAHAVLVVLAATHRTGTHHRPG